MRNCTKRVSSQYLSKAGKHEYLKIGGVSVFRTYPTRICLDTSGIRYFRIRFFFSLTGHVRDTSRHMPDSFLRVQKERNAQRRNRRKKRRGKRRNPRRIASPSSSNDESLTGHHLLLHRHPPIKRALGPAPSPPSSSTGLHFFLLLHRHPPTTRVSLASTFSSCYIVILRRREHHWPAPSPPVVVTVR